MRYCTISTLVNFEWFKCQFDNVKYEVLYLIYGSVYLLVIIATHCMPFNTAGDKFN